MGFLAICLVALLVMFLYLNVDGRSEYSLVSLNEELPKFKLPAINDLDHLLTPAILQDKITLINMWSNNCKVCKQEHGMLMTMAKDLQSKQYQSELNFIGLNNLDDAEVVKNWLKYHGDPYTLNLLDQKGQLANELGSTGLPELLIIDRDQVIQYRYSGMITPHTWQKKILPILDQLASNYSIDNSSS